MKPFMNPLPFLLASLLLLPAALQASSYARITHRLGDQPGDQVIDEQTGGQARAVVTRPEVTWVELPEPHYVTNQVAVVSATVSNHVMRLNGRTVAQSQQSNRLELEGRASGSFQFTGVTSRLYVKYRVQRQEVSAMQTLRESTSPPPVVQNNLVAAIRHNLTDHPLRPPCDAVAAGCDWRDPGAFREFATSPNTFGYECIADARYRRGSQIVILSSAGNTGMESFEETPCSSLCSLVSSQAISVSFNSVYLEESRDESLTETLETGWIRVDPSRETTFTFSASQNLSASSTNEVNTGLQLDDTLTLSLLLATDGALDPQAAGGFWHAAPPAGLPVTFTTVTAAEVVSPGPSRELVHSLNGYFVSSSSETYQHSHVLTSSWSAPPDSTGTYASTQTSSHSQFIDLREVRDISTDTKDKHTSDPDSLFTGFRQSNKIDGLITDPSPLAGRVFDSGYSLSRDQIQIESIATLNPGLPTPGTSFSVSEQTTFHFRLPKPSWLVFQAVCGGEEFNVRLSEGDVDLLSDSRILWDERLSLPPGEYILSWQCQTSPTIYESGLLIAIDPLCIAGITPSASGVELNLDRLLVGEEVVLEALEAGAESAAVEVARFVPTQSTHRVTWPVPPGDAPMLFRLRQASGPTPSLSGSAP